MLHRRHDRYGVTYNAFTKTCCSLGERLPKFIMLRKPLGGFASLTNYRLYRLDGAGKIASAEWLEAADGDHALQLARELKATTTVEVWNRNKFVGRISPATDGS